MTKTYVFFISPCSILSSSSTVRLIFIRPVVYLFLKPIALAAQLTTQLLFSGLREYLHGNIWPGRQQMKCDIVIWGMMSNTSFLLPAVTFGNPGFPKRDSGTLATVRLLMTVVG